MAQIDTTLYRTIADAYASIDTSLSTVSTSARTALDAIIDVDTGYLNPSSLEADAALEIELALLQVFNNAYVSSQSLQSSTASLLDAVRAVNDFVITNTTGTDTAVTQLNTWINTTMLGNWTGTNCPEGWANMSSDAGYTTTSWTTE